MTRRYTAAILLAAAPSLALLPMQGVAAQAVTSQTAQSEARKLLDLYPADGPGVGTIVTRDGEVLSLEVRGMADIENGLPITADTVFPLGSITKQFTAATVLKLVEARLMSLDDKLGSFFPDWPEPGRDATVRQLLNHTSGIIDYSKLPGWIAEHRDTVNTTDELVAAMKPLGSKARPGAEWEYNNGGYALLGAIIEKVSGRPWYEVLEERVTGPLGLGDIRYGGNGPLLRFGTMGYERKGEAQVPAFSPDLSVGGGAGSLVGTLAGLAAWNEALHGGKVLRPDLYEAMTSPAQLSDGGTAPYGFGLRLRPLLGRPMYLHGGSMGGFRADGAYLPESKVFVAVLGNSESPPADGTDIAYRLAAAATGQPQPLFHETAFEGAELDPLFGSYDIGDGRTMVFKERDGRLLISVGDDEREFAFGGSDRIYLPPLGTSWAEFERPNGGKPLIVFHEINRSAPLRAQWVGPVPEAFAVAPSILQLYSGTYQTETVAVKVELANERLTMITPDGEALMLRPVSNTEFMVEGTPMKVVFEPEDGRNDHFTMHRGARQLHGRRIAE